MSDLFFRALQHYEPDKYPWQKVAFSLLDYYFPDWKTLSPEKLRDLALNNPKTLSRFNSLWQGIPIYFIQRDNYTQPHRTCNSSSNAMFLLSFMPWLLYKGVAGTEDNSYLQKVIAIGDTTSHDVQTQVLKSYGLRTYWDTSGDHIKIMKRLEKSIPVPVNILHRGTRGNYRGGHVILLYGTTGSTFEYHDPYGNIHTDYKNTNGKSNIMTHAEFYDRWQKGARYTL